MHSYLRRQADHSLNHHHLILRDLHDARGIGLGGGGISLGKKLDRQHGILLLYSLRREQIAVL